MVEPAPRRDSSSTSKLSSAAASTSSSSSSSLSAGSSSSSRRRVVQMPTWTTHLLSGGGHVTVMRVQRGFLAIGDSMSYLHFFRLAEKRATSLPAHPTSSVADLAFCPSLSPQQAAAAAAAAAASAAAASGSNSPSSPSPSAASASSLSPQAVASQLFRVMTMSTGGEYSVWDWPVGSAEACLVNASSKTAAASARKGGGGGGLAQGDAHSLLNHCR